MGAEGSRNDATAGYAELIRGNADFRHLWYGQIVSLFGDWFNLIASASLVGRLTGSGMAIGGLFVVRMLAPFLVSPLAGVAADRYDRKKLLIATDVLRAFAVLGFLFVRRPEHVWMLYALTAFQLAMTGVFFPTRNAILPDIVTGRELGAANALSSATWSVMLALGAAVGGLVAGGWGIYPAFVIDSATFVLSAVFISRIHYRHRSGERKASLGGALRDYADGLRYLNQDRDLLAVALHKAALCLFVSGSYDVIQVSIAKDVFVIGEEGGIGLGLLYATTGVGAGVGPILARRFTGDRDRALRRALVFAYLILSAGLAMASTLASFAAVAIGVVLRGAGGGVIWVFSTQLLLQQAPVGLRGRMFATEFALLTLSMAIGSAAGGILLDQTSVGVSGILRAMAVLALLPGVLWGLWIVLRPVRRGL